MKVGFTGTRDGCTSGQLVAVQLWLMSHPADEYHHGDCRGADDVFFRLVRQYPGVTHAHPCDIPSERAFTQSAVIHPALRPLARNRVIVDACDVLLACPKGPEELRSGTWATIRDARKKGKRIVVFYPDGTVVEENNNA